MNFSSHFGYDVEISLFEYPHLCWDVCTLTCPCQGCDVHEMDSVKVREKPVKIQDLDIWGTDLDES